MSTIMKPTVGRKVWYRPSENERVGENAITVSPGQPVDATIVAVWGDNCVNLVLFDGNGKQHTRMSAYLKQGEDLPSWVTGYAEWMPYQVGQAKAQEIGAASPVVESQQPSRLSAHSAIDLRNMLDNMTARSWTSLEQLSFGKREVYTIDEVRAELASRAT